MSAADVQGGLTRSPGFAMARSAGDVEVYAVDGNWTARFNSTAALIWLLCDGRYSVSTLLESLCDLFPADEARVRDEVPELVSELVRLGLVHGGWLARFQPAPAPRSLVRVAFVDFWPGFNERRNYFVTMLSARFAPVLVHPNDDDLDLLFFSKWNASEPSRSAAHRGHVKSIFVGADDELPHEGDFDFAFTSGNTPVSARGRHFRLPIWALFTDWTAYDRAQLPEAHEQRLSQAFHPEAACLRLAEVLDLQGGARTERCLRAPSASAGRARRRAYRAPEPDPQKKLTIGMATHDDYDGVYFTVQALRLFHSECFPEVEIVVVDNDPEGRCGPALRKFVDQVDVCRYVPFFDFSSTCVKDLVFREARASAVLCIDSHVLLAPGSLKRLISFFDENPHCNDLLHGPLLADSLSEAGIRWTPHWRIDVRADPGERRHEPDLAPNAEPFEIDIQINALFACRKDAWLGFSPRFTGYGEEEFYIHEKFRKSGNKVLCLPFLRWMHRFGPRPKGTTYPMSWQDRLRNLLIGHRELDLDPKPVKDWFGELLGSPAFEDTIAQIEDEMNSPFFEFEVPYYIDAIGAGTEWDRVRDRLRTLGIHHPRRFTDVDPSEPPAAARLLGHRAVVEFARYARFESVIVFDRVDGLPEGTLEAVASSMERIRQADWGLWALVSAEAEGEGDSNRTLTGHDPARRTHAIAYHRRVFDDVVERLDAVASDDRALHAAALEPCLRGIGPVHVCAIRRG